MNSRTLDNERSANNGFGCGFAGDVDACVTKPRLLDLFCGAGGCTKGYQRAGFYVVGVDIAPQPNYCGDEFIQADALAFLQRLVNDNEVGRALGRALSFDAIHASPPCQGYLNLGQVNRALGRANDQLQLIAPVRDMLVATGLPYVIENVPDARWALRDPVQLCGSSFGLAVRRHRLFESNVPLMALPCAHHLQREPKYWTGWRPNGEKRLASVVQVYGNAGGREDWPAAMAIDWMTPEELAQAIPPAYTEHIGFYLMQELKSPEPTVGAQARGSRVSTTTVRGLPRGAG